MSSASTDRIEKEIVLESPRSRVWRAVTDVREFNQWFGVTLESPFNAGNVTSGKINIPGYEHVVLTAWVEKIEPEHFFSFRWHPHAIKAGVDYSREETTLVEFRLEEVTGGTKLTIIESGFDKLPESRRLEAFKSNDGGWASQTKRIADFIRANP